jgi:RNA polymerase sigma-70 factor (ECF subfamily)
MERSQLDIYIEKYINGDNSAFEFVYNETKKTVYLSIYSLIRDQSLIEDLMQDTYMKAINSLSYYKLGTNFSAWISRIARNTTLNFLKKRNREDIVDPVDNVFIDEVVDDKTYMLDSALKVLDESEKQIIVYRIIMGYTFKDISEIIETPLGTVYWVYQRAISKIKKEL